MSRAFVYGSALVLASVLVLMTGTAAAGAQEVILSRMPPAPVRGSVVEVSCFKHLGAAKVSTPEHVTCAKEALEKGGVLGILTDGDGVFKILGPLAANRYAKLVPYIGKQVEMTGAEVVVSNNYDYRSYEADKFAPVKK